MVKKIEQLYRWIETVITAIIGITSGYFVYEIQIVSNHKWALVILIVGLIVLCEKLLHIIFKKVINNSIMLRKLILREHFIEGLWFGKVINTGADNETYGYSIVRIEHKDHGYEVKGKVYDLQLKTFTAGFSSSDSHYYSEEQIFIYYFTGYNLYDGSAADIIGRTNLKVIQSHKYPTEFMGTVFDTKNKHELNLSLLKISEEESMGLNVNNKEGFEKLIKKLG